MGFAGAGFSTGYAAITVTNLKPNVSLFSMFMCCSTNTVSVVFLSICLLHFVINENSVVADATSAVALIWPAVG